MDAGRYAVTHPIGRSDKSIGDFLKTGPIA
jgi:hypothetical protein